MAHDVFISYASEDGPVAEKLCAVLEDAGVRCWIASRDVPEGVNFINSLVDAVEESRCLVLVFSGATNSNTNYVERELKAAIDADVPILPIFTEAVEPARHIRFLLGAQQRLDATAGMDADGVGAQVIQAVRRLLPEAPAEETTPPGSAEPAEIGGAGLERGDQPRGGGRAAGEQQPVAGAALDDRDAEAGLTDPDVLEAWRALRGLGYPAEVIARAGGGDLGSGVVRALEDEIARRTGMLARQVDAVLHHPAFQELEGAWRGVELLADQIETREGRATAVRLLNMRWSDIEVDLGGANSVQQSGLYRLIYDNGLGRLGGRCAGVLLLDFQVHHHALTESELYDGPESAGRQVADCPWVLSRLAEIAASAVAPAVIGVHPELFGVERFNELDRPAKLATRFQDPRWDGWRRLRAQPESMFLAMVMPRCLMRRPYRLRDEHAPDFPYEEDVSEPDGSGWLWGTPVYALGAMMMRSHRRCGWPIDIRGVRHGSADLGGVASFLPRVDFEADLGREARRPVTDLIVTEAMEDELSELGLIALSTDREAGPPIFRQTRTLMAIDRRRWGETADGRVLGALLPYVLAEGQVARWIKAVVTDKRGSLIEPAGLQDSLVEVIGRCAQEDEGPDEEARLRKPFRRGEVEVKPERLGEFQAVFRFVPHSLLEVATDCRVDFELEVVRRDGGTTVRGLPRRWVYGG